MMEPEFTKAETEYFGLAETWDQELYGKLKRDRNIALGVAAVAAILAGLSIIAVMMLTPLKSVEPYIILVDKSTGHSEAVRKLVYSETSPLTEKESFVLAEINKYVLTRHTYDPFDSPRRRLTMQMTTNKNEIRRYRREAATDQEDLGTSTRRFVNIKSVVPNLADKSAQVRFSTTLETPGGPGATEHWIATLKYNFVDLNLQMKYRHLNPLGFIVTSYRVDPETLQ